ncbi:MAG: Coenzyme F420 hydrogenase/dehydrogenase, beta subunit C-terminal domain [Pseudomonadota bacterium]
MCTDCGISRTDTPQNCGRACQFIQPDYPALEKRVHGRMRDPERGDERFFGPYLAMYEASMIRPAPGAQWTGLTTGLAEQLLAAGAVDAVICMGPDPQDRWRPRPIIVTSPEGMAQARGMRMGYAPLLAALAPARAAGHRKIAVIGIPCQIYAVRALEAEWGFDEILVIGTPCSDNTSTENFHRFLRLLTPTPENVTYLEFRADYRVEMRFADGSRREIPFLNLPLSDLPADFFPLTCRTCVDYTNSLADITVGYMAGRGRQWIIVRNARGKRMLDALAGRVALAPVTSAGARAGAVKGFIQNTKAAAGGLPLRRMPRWVRPIVSWLQPRTGPRGLEFARTRLEMKAAETVLHLRAKASRRMKHMVPTHVWDLVRPYGLVPQAGETHSDPTPPNGARQRQR